MLKDHLKDISHLTKEQIEAMCEPAILDKDNDEKVLLSSDSWIEEDGIRFLKKPLKVDRIPWSIYTAGCSSIMAAVSRSDVLYVFAFSTDEKSDEGMGNDYYNSSIWKIGYDYISGFNKEDIDGCSID